MATAVPLDHALDAFDAVAAHYDAFTAHHDYDLWLERLLGVASDHDFIDRPGVSALDIACGTAKSTEPLIDRGYVVVACDRSPAMLEQAALKTGGRAELLVGDVRNLPSLGSFELITCLGDVPNYITDSAELVSLFASVARNLSGDGIFVCDLNTLRTYEEFFGSTFVTESDGWFSVWAGMVQRHPPPGVLAHARLHLFEQCDDGGWSRHDSDHYQRHHPEAMVRATMQEAGLEPLAVVGQFPDATFEAVVDERRHTKVIYFARLATHG